jgi:hypothetical protein
VNMQIGYVAHCSAGMAGINLVCQKKGGISSLHCIVKRGIIA